MKKVVPICLLLVATTALADSLEEKQFWKRQRDYIDRSLKTAENACGVKFVFDWENAATLRAETEKTKHSPNGVCTSVIDAVARICRIGADEKSTVAAKITGFSCGFAKPRSLELDGKIVRYRGNNSEPNFDPWANTWLLKHL